MSQQTDSHIMQCTTSTVPQQLEEHERMEFLSLEFFKPRYHGIGAQIFRPPKIDSSKQDIITFSKSL